MLSPWTERPQEVSNLLNPAFLGAMLHRAISGFSEIAEAGMPFEQVVLILPLVLHPTTRGKLPAGVSTIFAAWVQDHRDVLIEFAPRTKSLLPYTKESLTFLMSNDMIVVDTTGRFRSTDKSMKGKTTYPKLSEEVNEFWLKSHFVGRWLAGAGTSTTIYSLLGICP